MTESKTHISTKIMAFGLAILVAFLFSGMLSQSVSAQAEDEVLEITTTSETEADATVEEETPSQVTYKYIAEECDSLTKLVRRAILVYDEANDDIELTKPGIIYAETNIVQNMGAYLLDIGDEVIVDGQEVRTYALSSLNLTEEQIAAWDVYTPNVDFTITDIQQPEDVDEVVEDIQDEIDAEEDEDEEEVTEDSASAGWWFAGLGGAAVVWYLLWKREES